MARYYDSTTKFKSKVISQIDLKTKIETLNITTVTYKSKQKEYEIAYKSPLNESKLLYVKHLSHDIEQMLKSNPNFHVINEVVR